MCFTLTGRLQTRLLSLFWPLLVTIAFATAQENADYWTLFQLMALVGFALDLFVYPRYIQYQSRWLTIALAGLEFLVIRLATLFPFFAVRLSDGAALLFYLVAWLGVWLTTQMVLPLVWPKWAEDGGEWG